MKALFNNQLIEASVSVPLNDRALQFGDGLFETIKVSNGNIQLLDYHLSRLSAGADALGFELPDYLRREPLEEKIIQLMPFNGLQNDANIKLTVWRQHQRQKAYASREVLVNTLLLARERNQPVLLKEKCSFSDDVRLHYWKFSRFKTTSALPYVMAARERDQRDLDELILLNMQEKITECVSSNIFWINNEVLFTPSLYTGCIAGVMRAFLFDYCKENDMEIREVEAEKHQLLEADAVFTSNSQGLQEIRVIDEASFGKSALLEQLLTGLDERLT